MLLQQQQADGYAEWRAGGTGGGQLPGERGRRGEGKGQVGGVGGEWGEGGGEGNGEEVLW